MTTSALEFRNWSDYCERVGISHVLSDCANACFAAKSTKPEAFLATYLRRNVAVDVVESISAVEVCDGSGGFTTGLTVTLASGLSLSTRGSSTQMIATHPSTARTVCYTTMPPQGAAIGPRLSTPAAAPPPAKGAPPPPPKVIPLQGVQRYDLVVEYLKNHVASGMRGVSIVDQTAFDDQLVALEGTQNLVNLLAPTVAGISLLGAALASRVLQLPLYRHIASLRSLKQQQQQPNNATKSSVSSSSFSIPRPIVSIVAVEPKWLGRVRVRELSLIPPVSSQAPFTMSSKVAMQLSAIFDVASTRVEDPSSLNADGTFRFNGFESLQQMVEWIEEIVRESNQGVVLGTGPDEWGVSLTIDGGLSYKPDGQKYNLIEGTDASGGQIAELLAQFVKEKKVVTYLEDPLGDHDIAEMRRLMHRVGATVTVASAHVGAGNSAATRRCASELLCNNLVLRLNDCGTVSNLLEQASLFTKGYPGTSLTIASDWNEQHGVELVDIAVGLGASFVKIGGLYRQERAAMLQRLLDIQSELVEQGAVVASDVSIATPEAPLSQLVLPPAPLEPVVELNAKPDKKKK